MSMTTWSQYVSMDEPGFEPCRMQTTLECSGNWDDEDFELGEPWGGDDLATGED
jgi:hypothetical protein